MSMLRFLPNARSDARTGPEWPEYEPWKSGAVASDGQRQASQAHDHSPVPGARERIPLDRVVKPGPGLSRSIWVFLARAGMFTFSLASGHLHPSWRGLVAGLAGRGFLFTVPFCSRDRGTVA